MVARTRYATAARSRKPKGENRSEERRVEAKSLLPAGRAADVSVQPHMSIA